MDECEVPKARWKNMRRMAWIAFGVALFLFPALVMVKPALAEIAVPVYSLCGSIIVVGYMGVSAAADAWGPNWRR